MAALTLPPVLAALRNMKRLEGKIAVVTGGSTGTSFTRGSPRLTAPSKAFKATIADLAHIERMRAHIAQNHGCIDVIFANAGGGTLGAFGSVTEADMRRTPTYATSASSSARQALDFNSCEPGGEPYTPSSA